MPGQMFRQPVHEQIEQLPADLVQSVRTLSLRLHPGTSAMGILWLTLTLAVMLILAAGKHHTGKQLDNPVLLTEGRVTLVDALLAGAVLVGLVLNALLGWWWADPMASLVQKIRDGFRFFKANGSAKPETPIDLLH
jgi:divalent metal cation (Fe/Co/Zn/Cd) transporter